MSEKNEQKGLDIKEQEAKAHIKKDEVLEQVVGGEIESSNIVGYQPDGLPLR